MIYRGEKIENTFDSEFTRAFKTEKVSYKWWTTPFYELSSNLTAAYNLPTYFTDKSQIYTHDNTVNVNTKFFLFDSEGGRVWTPKNNGLGSSRINYDSDRLYMYPRTKLQHAQIYPSYENKLNVSPDLYESNDFMVTLHGQNLLTEVNNNTQIRTFRHTDFNGERVPAVWMRTGVSNVAIDDWLDSPVKTRLSKIASTYNCYGTYVRNATANSSTEYNLGFSGYNSNLDYYIHYLTEFDDSEIKVDELIYKVWDDSDLPNRKINWNQGPFTGFLTNFNTWQGNEAPMNVFNDSENYGFKATIGRQAGYIGYQVTTDSIFSYNLKRVTIRNTPATRAMDRPYDFDIEGVKRDGTWVTLHEVRGFDSYVFDYSFPDDSERLYFGFRVNFIACQPGFSGANGDSLEVKEMNFVVNRFELPVNRAGKGLFFTQENTSYQFTVGDEDIAFYGAVIGAGGGGGNNFDPGDQFGGGGGGGGAVIISHGVLPRNKTYRVTVGAGGLENSNGGNTVILNVTDNQNIVAGLGGGGGTGGVSVNPAAGGTGGSTLVSSNPIYSLVTSTFTGGDGGIGRFADNGDAGDSGAALAVRSYVGPKEHVNLTTNFIAGGGGGACQVTTWVDGGAAGGTSAGRGGGVGYNGQAGAANRGGGGGGAGDKANGTSWPGHSGGSGYAYIIFK